MSENEDVRSECKKCGENSRQMAPVSTICDEYCDNPGLVRDLNSVVKALKAFQF